MAEAEEQGLTAAIQEQELTMPVMPHIALTATELDRLYPPMVPAPEVDNPDLADEALDATFQAGMRIASQVEAEMATLGRIRKEGQMRSRGVEAEGERDLNINSSAALNITNALSFSRR